MNDTTPDSDSLELGIEPMDAEHRGQLERMDRLARAIEQEQPSQKIARDLEELVSYLNLHFLSEQILMREQGFPGYEAHLREHEDAVELLRELEGRCSTGDAQVSIEILQALRGWLVEHIQTADRSLAQFVSARPAQDD